MASIGYCPSCMKTQDRIAICSSCVERRDKKYEHSEVDIQQQLKKEIDGKNSNQSVRRTR